MAQSKMYFVIEKKDSDQSSDEETNLTLVDQSSRRNVRECIPSKTVFKVYELSGAREIFPENPLSLHCGTEEKSLPTSSTLQSPSTTVIERTPSGSSEDWTKALTTAIKTLHVTSTAAAKSNLLDAKGFLQEKPSTSRGAIAKAQKQKPARAYIFNHEKFDSEKEDRAGSAQDVKALLKTFGQLKCKVEVIRNATLANVRNTVQKLESKNFTKQSALVIVILTHGSRYDKLAAKDSDYSLNDDVIFPILRNQTLKNKPKLVFVQACKGTIKLDSFKTDTVQPHGIPAELLLCYSTYEGYVSYRDDVDGSHYIQTLSEALQKYGRTKDIMSIMTKVTCAVKATTQDRQIPSFTSTLTSKYTFGDYM